MENSPSGVTVKSLIPIENIYYLFCYAWKLFPQGSANLTGVEEFSNLQTLLAHVLCTTSEKLLRKGMNKGYISRQEDMSVLRGKIVLSETVRRNLSIYCRAHCQFDELELDILANQILKTTLAKLSEADSVNRKVAHRAAVLARNIPQVSTVPLNSALFRRVQLHRNNAEYGLLLNICELLFHGLIPNQDAGPNKFSDILSNEVAMSAVFEEFLRSFANAETPYRGGAQIIRWDGVTKSGVLPVMRTDATLRSRIATVVVEAKFYRSLFVNFMGGRKLRSAHVYQLFSYLKNLEAVGGQDARASGLLIYPTVEDHLEELFILGGHKIRVVTLNLNRAWELIHKDLATMFRDSETSNLAA